MTSREIVKRAITFDRPPRLPMKFDIVGVNDCWDVWTVDPTGWEWTFPGQRMADEWGCVWEKTGVSNSGQVVGHPLADFSKLKDYKWPDVDDPRRYRGFAEQLAGAGDKFVMFCFGQGVWERLHLLTGMDKAMLGFLKHKEEVHEIVRRVLEHHLGVLRKCCEIASGTPTPALPLEGGGSQAHAPAGPPASPPAGLRCGRLDAAAMADDWGVQDRAFISVKMFREFFKPLYQRWFDEIKVHGLHPWLHSCGKINTLLPELIDCGLEVINNQQPNTVGLREFGDAFRGKICFEAIVDTQDTLPRGTYDEIRQQARDICDYYGTPAGGLIASDYNDAEAIGVTNDRRYVMFDAFAERGGYPNYPEILARAKAGRIERGHLYGRATETA
jgi:uroporphyrinogen decarboxylase